MATITINYYKNSTRISYHCWTESMVSRLVWLQEGQLIPQHYYVLSRNKHVNMMDDYMALLQWFLLVTIEQEANLQLIVLDV